MHQGTLAEADASQAAASICDRVINRWIHRAGYSRHRIDWRPTSLMGFEPRYAGASFGLSGHRAAGEPHRVNDSDRVAQMSRPPRR
jgi:hypothetical protein